MKNKIVTYGVITGLVILLYFKFGKKKSKKAVKTRTSSGGGGGIRGGSGGSFLGNVLGGIVEAIIPPTDDDSDTADDFVIVDDTTDEEIIIVDPADEEIIIDDEGTGGGFLGDLLGDIIDIIIPPSDDDDTTDDFVIIDDPADEEIIIDDGGAGAGTVDNEVIDDPEPAVYSPSPPCDAIFTNYYGRIANTFNWNDGSPIVTKRLQEYAMATGSLEYKNIIGSFIPITSSITVEDFKKGCLDHKSGNYSTPPDSGIGILPPEDTILYDEPVYPTDEPILNDEPILPDKPILSDEPILNGEPILPDEPILSDEPIIPIKPIKILYDEPILSDEPVLEEPIPVDTYSGGGGGIKIMYDEHDGGSEIEMFEK